MSEREREREKERGRERERERETERERERRRGGAENERDGWGSAGEFEQRNPERHPPRPSRTHQGRREPLVSALRRGTRQGLAEVERFPRKTVCSDEILGMSRAKTKFLQVQVKS